MASIGGKTMTTMRGTVRRAAINAQPIDRYGVDGLGFRDTGYRERASTLTTTATAATPAAAQTLCDDYAKLQGTVVAVVDPHGTTHANVLVFDVSDSFRKVLLTTSAADTYIVTARWTLFKLYTPEAGA